MRLFTAIDIPEELKMNLDKTVPKLPGWKKTGREQLHITVVFLGECTDDEKKKISHFLKRILFECFELTVDRLGVFPNQEDPRILWAGIGKSKAIMELQSKISEILGGYGTGNEHHTYIPHITVARRKGGVGRDQNVDGLIEKNSLKASFWVDRFLLKRSVLSTEGSNHEILEEFAATGSEDLNHKPS